jgi:hypothetical protein
LRGILTGANGPSSVAALRPSYVALRGVDPSAVALRRVERVDGNEGGSVGETPTGATGTVAVPKGLDCNQLRGGLKTPWGPVFAESADGEGVLGGRAEIVGRVP